MNGFEYTPIKVNLPEPKPEPRKAPPCPDCKWWGMDGNCHTTYGYAELDFSCFNEDNK